MSDPTDDFPTDPSGLDTAVSARERIVRAAHDLFYGDGIRATGIDRIIASAGVTKVTFYRHFPSKNDLIVAYLDHRHALWMQWFRQALERHRDAASVHPWQPLADAMAEWLGSPSFRGCAFLNAVVELEGALPVVADLTRRHKADMTHVLEDLWPGTAEQKRSQAELAALVVDGAILRAQMDRAPGVALSLLQRLLSSAAPPSAS